MLASVPKMVWDGNYWRVAMPWWKQTQPTTATHLVSSCATNRKNHLNKDPHDLCFSGVESLTPLRSLASISSTLTPAMQPIFLPQKSPPPPLKEEWILSPFLCLAT